MHLAISASDSTVVDIYYMLLEGGKAVYITKEQAVPIAGSYSTPIAKDYAWKQILQKGHIYEGRVKIVELNHNQIRAFMNSFQAVDDASITETYQDETGASATVLGNSRVPFVGYLRFTLYQNGSLLNITEKKTPVLLAGDDETVEITWNGTLEPGIYQLRTVLLSQDGSVMDLEENVIEAEPLQRINATDTAEKSGLPSGLAALVVLIAALMRRRR
jgi:MYXO-CTERM domain-containing protein